MFKKSLALFREQLIRCVVDVNLRHTVYLMTTCLDESNFLESSRGIKPISLSSRSYAKSRDIKKEKKKNVKIDENELAETFDIEKLNQEFVGPVEYFKSQLIEHATLRSSQGAIENLKIQHEGKTYVIQDLAQVGKKNPRLYVLDFSAFPQTIQAAMQVLRSSELNVNAQQDGTKVFVPIAKVTKEHRELLVKKSKGYFNNCKNTIRDIQNKYVKNLKNQGGLTHDQRFRLQEQLYAVSQKYVKSAEDILKSKQAELLREDQG